MTLAVSVIAAAHPLHRRSRLDRAVLDHAADAGWSCWWAPCPRETSWSAWKNTRFCWKASSTRGDRGEQQGHPAADQHQTFATGFHVSDSMAASCLLPLRLPASRPARGASAAGDGGSDAGTRARVPARSTRTRGRSCPTRKKGGTAHVPERDQRSHCCIRHALRRFAVPRGALEAFAPTHSVMWRSRRGSSAAPPQHHGEVAHDASAITSMLVSMVNRYRRRLR